MPKLFKLSQSVFIYFIRRGGWIDLFYQRTTS